MIPQTLKQHYQQLGSRDRKAVHLLAVFLGLILLGYGIVLPSYHFYRDNRADYLSQQTLLAWVQANADRARALPRQRAQAKPSQPILQTVSSSAGQFGLNPNRLQPEGAGRLRLWLNDAPFNKTIQWLNQIAEQFGITIQEISIEKNPKPGLVNIQCLLGNA